MTATAFLDDPATPLKLHQISVAMKEASYSDDRGRMRALDLELKRICLRIRDEMRYLHGRADPDLLIALWSTAQLSHAAGLEYAKTDSRPAPEAEEVPEPPAFPDDQGLATICTGVGPGLDVDDLGRGDQGK